MNLIALVDRYWAIGYQGKLLVRIPLDQKYFQDMTKGKVVVYGRKTLETFPNGMPLMQRRNIILSRNKNFSARNAEVVHSEEEALNLLFECRKEDIFIVGGESIYRMFLPYCDTAYITKVDYIYQADVHMPNLDSLLEWKLVEKSEEQTYFNLEYYFLKYKRVPFCESDEKMAQKRGII